MAFDYKRLIKNQKTRFLVLKILGFVPDAIMLKFQYWLKLGRKLNLKNPERFTEKIQLYKMYYRNPVLGACVDKYAVREYINSKGLKEILNDLYFVYDFSEEIDFSKLPNQFVLKTTDGSGGENVIICKDKSSSDLKEIKTKLSKWKDKKNINAGREWAYTQIKKSRIVAEKYLESPENPEAGIEDYKFLCFSGKPKYVIVDKDRYIEHKRNFYTIDKSKLDVDSDCKQFDDDYCFPKNYDAMVLIAEKLSEDFPFVRVDLYNVSGKILFGELTFYPWSGFVQFSPDEFDYMLGKDFKESEILRGGVLKYSKIISCRNIVAAHKEAA